MPIACLLINFALGKDRISYILSIVLLPCFNIVVVVDSKSLRQKSRATAVVILFQISQFGVIEKNRTSAKILMTGFLKPFGLLICG